MSRAISFVQTPYPWHEDSEVSPEVWSRPSPTASVLCSSRLCLASRRWKAMRQTKYSAQAYCQTDSVLQQASLWVPSLLVSVYHLAFSPSLYTYSFTLLSFLISTNMSWIYRASSASPKPASERYHSANLCDSRTDWDLEVSELIQDVQVKLQTILSWVLLVVNTTKIQDKSMNDKRYCAQAASQPHFTLANQNLNSFPTLSICSAKQQSRKISKNSDSIAQQQWLSSEAEEVKPLNRRPGRRWN